LASRKALESLIPTLGKFSQAFGSLNRWFPARKDRNGGILRFFRFGTADAEYPASPGQTRTTPDRRLPMFAIETSNRLFAAAFSVVLSAAAFAYAIIPASPTLVA